MSRLSDRNREVGCIKYRLSPSMMALITSLRSAHVFCPTLLSPTPALAGGSGEGGSAD